MNEFKREDIKFFSLNDRKSKSSIKDIAIDPEKSETELKDKDIEKIAKEIIDSRKNGKPVILAFGAHLIKNGLGTVIKKMIEEGYVTHLATNGASSIHDWEIAFDGKTEEDVRENIKDGRFGTWEETGKFINLSIICGSKKNKGYGEIIGELISEDKIEVMSGLFNDPELAEKLRHNKINPGKIKIDHPFKEYSIFYNCYINNVLLTVHPGFGYDIIYTHPLNDGASIGKAAEIDFLRFVDSVSRLNGGVYISIGSAIMSPMIFEKALSMARNVKSQSGKDLKDFSIVINDIQEGEWDWGSGKEPEKNDPAYYLRFCKTFDRVGAKKMYYLKKDNRSFLLELYHQLKVQINS